jgi:hypothetical protein
MTLSVRCYEGGQLLTILSMPTPPRQGEYLELGVSRWLYQVDSVIWEGAGGSVRLYLTRKELSVS